MATSLEMILTSSRVGINGAFRSPSAGDHLPSSIPAAETMPSDTSLALHAIVPNAKPGKMNALLQFPIRRRLPPYTTSGNGVPVATSARPRDHLRISSGGASAFEVGFDSGKMIGQGQCADISRTISSVNVPGWVDVPISMVGCALNTTSLRVIFSGLASFHPVKALRGRA